MGELVNPTTTPIWGPLAHPVDPQVTPGGPAWRDNAYLTFWSDDLTTFGCFHASTSPNAPGRRTRLSVSHQGAVVEIVDEPNPGTFNTASLSFDLDTQVRIDHPRLNGEIRCAPLWAPAEYSQCAIPSLEGGTPLTHHQRAGRFTGDLTFDGHAVTFTGSGFRDRTWGSRDEAVSIDEYIGLMGVYSNCAITVIRMRSTSGVDHTEGFVLDESGSRAVSSITDIVRDASGLYVSSLLTYVDGEELTLATTGRAGGFWLPLGAQRSGPVISAYDEYTTSILSGGQTGVTMIEQGVLKTL
jgi:hypothetical protein